MVVLGAAVVVVVVVVVAVVVVEYPLLLAGDLLSELAGFRPRDPKSPVCWANL